MTLVIIQPQAIGNNIKAWLGSGVDLFDNEPLTTPNTKPAALLKKLPDGAIKLEPAPATNYTSIWADSLSEISHKLAVEAGLAGSYGGVSGNVEAKFRLSGTQIEKMHFLQISFNAAAAYYSITKSAAGLQREDLLDPDFKEALEKWDDWEKLFTTYGTHLIIKMLIGGRAEYYCKTSDIYSMTEDEFQLAAKAKYEDLGGSAEGSGLVGTANEQKKALVSGSDIIATVGGSSSAAVQIKMGAWASWVQTIAANPAFLGFAKDGLLPISDLAPSPARQKAIYEAYMRRAAKALHVEIFSVTSPTPVNHPEASVKVPDGYKLLGGGARDNWHGKGNMLTASFPEGNPPNVWTARGKDHLAQDEATITVYALALYDPLDLWEVKVSKQDIPSTRGWILFKDCAVESGYTLVGGGAMVDYGTDKGTLLFTSQPWQGNKWIVHAKDQIESSSAKLSVYAVGLRPKPGKLTGVTLKTEFPKTSSSTSKRPTGTASPSTGYKMVGGGASLNWPGFNEQKGEGLLLTSSYPKDSETWEASGKDHVKGCDGFIDVYCIGLKVE